MRPSSQVSPQVSGTCLRLHSALTDCSTSLLSANPVPPLPSQNLPASITTCLPRPVFPSQRLLQTLSVPGQPPFQLLGHKYFTPVLEHPLSRPATLSPPSGRGGLAKSLFPRTPTSFLPSSFPLSPTALTRVPFLNTGTMQTLPTAQCWARAGSAGNSCRLEATGRSRA